MAYFKISELPWIRISHVKWQQEINLQEKGWQLGWILKLDAVKLFLCILAVLSTMLTTVEMPNLYWKGKLSFRHAYKCLHCLTLQFSKVFSIVKNVLKLDKSHLCQDIKEENILGIFPSLNLFVTFNYFFFPAHKKPWVVYSSSKQ